MLKPWIQTFTGRPVFLFEPKPSDFVIEDIAHSLAMQCRFNGHTRWHYSVAEHSIRVARLLEEWGEPRDVVFAGLMHDAAEAYMGDIVWPLKRELAGLKEIESAIERELFAAFGLPAELPPVVKEADLVMLLVEKNAMLASPPIPWDRGEPELPDWTITKETSWGSARQMFLERFVEIIGAGSKRQ